MPEVALISIQGSLVLACHAIDFLVFSFPVLILNKDPLVGSAIIAQQELAPRAWPVYTDRTLARIHRCLPHPSRLGGEHALPPP